jgi:hypothetical protein
VDVQLRVAVAAGVLGEHRHRDVVGVFEPPGLGAVDPPPVVPGAHVPGLALHVRDVQADRRLDLGPDPGSPGLPHRRCLQVPGLLGFGGRRQSGCVGQRDRLVDAERGVEVLHPHGPVIFGPGLGEQPHPLVRRRPRASCEPSLVDHGQPGVDPRRAAEIGAPERVARIEEMAVQRLEAVPLHRVAVLKSQLSSTIAEPCARGLATLLCGGQVVPRAPLAGDVGAFGGADGLERVRRVVPPGDAHDDRHAASSIFSTTFNIDLCQP